MRILLVHSGTSFSTSDVYDGIEAGLRANAVEVVPYRLDRIVATYGVLLRAATETGLVAKDAESEFQSFLLHAAGAELVSAALDQEVDAVVVVCGLLLGLRRPRLLQKLGLPVACYGTEAPYFLDSEVRLASSYTHWFTNERRSVEALGRATRAFYLPHAYHPERHRLAPPDDAKRCDAVFVGSGFPERQALFGGADWSGIHLVRHGTDWSEGEAPGENAISNEETCAWYRSARIAINHHRTSTIPGSGGFIATGSAESLGPRAYEIPACGGFMLCDDARAELGEVFGDAVPTYKAGSSEDLERQVRYWLRHDGRREERAREQHEAIRPHSWTTRVEQMLARIVP